MPSKKRGPAHISSRICRFPRLGIEVDPQLEALIERNFKEGMKVTKTYALERSKDPFWPIGLCVAWVLGRDPSKATRIYARHRLGIGVIHVKGWIDARTSLLRALAAGKIEALGVGDGRRVSIPAQEWINLRIQQRGSCDEVAHGDGSIAYRDVRVASAKMRDEWPVREAAKDQAPEQQKSEAVEPPAETPAMKEARDRQENERACLNALMERMSADPDVPVAKEKLRQDFSKISERAFDRTLFTSQSRNQMRRLEQGRPAPPHNNASGFGVIRSNRMTSGSFSLLQSPRRENARAATTQFPSTFRLNNRRG